MIQTAISFEIKEKNIKNNYAEIKRQAYDYCYNKRCHSLYYKFSYKGIEYKGNCTICRNSTIGDWIIISFDNTNPNNTFSKLDYLQRLD